MAINKNHEFEEINGIKCSIVEKNISKNRALFLLEILHFNKYEVEINPQINTAEENVLFTVGVTNLLFNATNAIFGRLLRNKENEIVTLDFWKEKTETIENKPYYQQKN